VSVDALLSGLSLVWTEDGVRPSGTSIWLDRAAASGHDSLSLLVFRGEAPFDAPGDVIAIRAFPHLDEAWALYLIAQKRAGKALPASWEAMCRYAGDVRQGLWPDRVSPEHAVQAVYLAMAQHHLLEDPPRREAFVEDALALCAIVADKLETGARLYDDDLVAGEARLERYVALLAQDRELYEEDLGRSRAFLADLPGGMSPGGAARTLSLLAISRPVSTQFKLWARTDARAPGGRGYPLLLVEQDRRMIVLSADPASRVKIGLAAKALGEREKRARGGEDKPWYDGKDHGGTIAAAPREGTALSLDDVLDCLKSELRLRSIKKDKPTSRLLGIVAAVAACAAGALGIGLFLASRERAPAPSPSGSVATETATETTETRPRGSKGDPLPVPEVISLIARSDGPRSIVPYALIAGVCGYEGEHELHSPCRDARAMRDLLIERYGYARENILFLVDRPLHGEPTDGAPTAEGLKLAVEKFRARFGDREDTSFLFYYSGHGGYIKGARQDYGVLQPAEFFGKLRDLPNSHKGWDMQDLVGDIRKGVPSKHVMLLLDCCYSGWAMGAKGDDELEAYVGSLWKERAEVVLTAGSKGQRAWEDDPDPRSWAWDGHSAMTAFLLEALTVSAEGTAAADSNQDHVVTDEELARFVKERVPASVKEQKGASQTPTLFRFDATLPKSGQFLFVPRPRG